MGSWQTHFFTLDVGLLSMPVLSDAWNLLTNVEFLIGVAALVVAQISDSFQEPICTSFYSCDVACACSGHCVSHRGLLCCAESFLQSSLNVVNVTSQ